MNTWRAQLAIMKVARNHGISTEDVVWAIEEAIALAKLDPVSRLKLYTLTGGREVNSAVEFITFIMEEYEKEK